jgi:hypothetical protein
MTANRFAMNVAGFVFGKVARHVARTLQATAA